MRFYSVFVSGRLNSEFKDFLLRMAKENKVELAELNRYIQVIGQKYGALEQHFKNEDAAERLPPPYHQFIETEDPDNYGLRLYCIRLSPSVVILLNGDRKTTRKVLECRNCKAHFKFADALAKKITQAILDGHMGIDEEEMELWLEEDFEINL